MDKYTAQNGFEVVVNPDGSYLVNNLYIGEESAKALVEFFAFRFVLETDE